ncbi:hypothetical protein PFBG_04704 [Plasmodium falciparum 7G8]|nr:hypothetical protein PFTANZ_04616 [Plasmodium falciparum Tanzania (2000708)]ETW40538.1 hypothetical protein PFNF135_04843 [Plasmodium falciparum NF135/5.C10]EUR65962.1 hypothetical protein PFBG_04704 [Plasmodium falciparum 7G8]
MLYYYKMKISVLKNNYICCYIYFYILPFFYYIYKYNNIYGYINKCIYNYITTFIILIYRNIFIRKTPLCYN